MKTVAFAFVLVAVGSHAVAQDLSALTKARNWPALEAAADARLAQDPNHAEALVAKVNSILSSGDAKRVDKAVELAERCVAAHAQSAACHEALGASLGTRAMNAGVMSALGYAGRIRDSFKTAVELDPKNWSARMSLLQYYLAAPSIVGGGKARANELVADTGKTSADAGLVLRAAVALADKNAEAAEKALAAVGKTLPDDELREQFQQMLIGTVAQFIREKKFDDATRAVKDLAVRFPGTEWVPYGYGRIAQEQGKFNDAIDWYKKALVLKNEAVGYFRMGQCFDGLNDKAQALANYERALAFKTGLSKSQREDAQQRAKQLKTGA
jgi:tetratricopeptide (TPR) repeat protein